MSHARLVFFAVIEASGDYKKQEAFLMDGLTVTMLVVFLFLLLMVVFVFVQSTVPVAGTIVHKLTTVYTKE